MTYVSRYAYDGYWLYIVADGSGQATILVRYSVAIHTDFWYPRTPATGDILCIHSDYDEA